MHKGNREIEPQLRGRKSGPTKEQLGQRLKGIISDISLDRVEERKRVNDQLMKITSLEVMDGSMDRIEKEKKTGKASSIDEIINEMEIECQRILETI